GLLIALDADSFRERQIASRQLRQAGQDAVEFLQRFDRKKLSPQQQTEVDAFLHEMAGVTSEQIDRLSKDPSFLVDCLYCQEEDIRTTAMERLRQLAHAQFTFDVKADPLNQAVGIESLRSKLLSRSTTKPAR